MYLLDTNVLSELRKTSTGRGAESLVAWASSVDQSLTFISAMSIYEIEVGVRSAERRDPAQGAALRRWLEIVVAPEFSRRIIAVDETIAKTAAALNVPNRRPFIDGLIAATAVVRRLTIVTRNIRDFQGVDVAVLNPWDA